MTRRSLIILSLVVGLCLTSATANSIRQAEVAGNIATPMIATAGQQMDDPLTGEVVITVLLCVLGVMVLRLVVRSRRTGKNIKRYQQEEAAIAAEIAARKKASDEKKVFPRIWRA